MGSSDQDIQQFDTIVVGAGPAGIEAATTLAKGGQKVALIEKNQVGGTCVNRGCIPAKTMLQMASRYRGLKHLKDYGIALTGEAKVDYQMMAKKREQIIVTLRGQIKEDLQKLKVELFEQEGIVTSQNRVELADGQLLQADHVVLATGGRARRFPGFVDEDPRFLTSDDIFSLKEIPESIAIVGAGPVGTEFASFYRALGAEVTIIDLNDVYLGNYDHNLGKELIKRFEADGISCRRNSMVASIGTDDELLSIKLDNDEELEAQYILSAIGVEIRTDYLEAVDLDKERGRLVVNDQFQTNVARVYAVGDLIGRSGSAYGAEREARAVAYQILGKDAAEVPVDYALMPDVVFTEPEVATCGASMQELTKNGQTYQVIAGTYDLNSKAHILNETSGKVWIYFAPGSERLLGVHIIGAHATEVIHQVPAWLQHQYTLTDVKKLVWGHPVLAELIRDVIMHGDYSE